METLDTSLAVLLFLLISGAYLSGPLAYALAVARFNILAVLLAGLSIWLGTFWLLTIYTGWKYLGLVSAGIGVLALLKATGNFYDHDK